MLEIHLMAYQVSSKILKDVGTFPEMEGSTRGSTSQHKFQVSNPLAEETVANNPEKSSNWVQVSPVANNHVEKGGN